MTILEQLDKMGACSKQKGILKVNNEIGLPYTLLKGQCSQPILTILAAVHACEYVGVKTTMELAQKWQFDKHGSVLLIHAVNITGLTQSYHRYVPEDNINLNSIFQDTTYQDTLSYAIKRTIQEHVFPHTNYLVDLHGGSSNELLTPHGYCSTQSQPDIFQTSHHMLLASQTPIIYHSSARGGVYQSAAIDYHIPSILLEQGDNGACRTEDVTAMMKAIHRIADYVFDGELFESQMHVKVIKNATYTYCTVDGFWTCNVKPNQQVQKGEKVGEIVDQYGEKLIDITAETTGIILYHKASLVAKRKDLLIAIGSEEK